MQTHYINMNEYTNRNTNTKSSITSITTKCNKINNNSQKFSRTNQNMGQITTKRNKIRIFVKTFQII